MPHLTADYVREILDYDPDTGIFIWKACPSYRVAAGRIAGSRYKPGHILIEIDHRRYRAHRLAWLIMTGEWPKEIDHVDRDPSNNRWTNLRLATRSQNNRNRGLQSNNTNGFRGVCFHRLSNKYQGRIWFNGQKITVGYFDTPEEAYAARCTKAKQLYGDFYVP